MMNINDAARLLMVLGFVIAFALGVVAGQQR